MNGSDSERMIAEIEAFLRTGSAPPPGPEPAGMERRPRLAAGGRGPAHWTPLRVAVVVSLLLGLLVLPVLYSDHSSGPTVPMSGLAGAATGSAYTFLRLNPSGTPVRWNPCVPVYYETNLAGAPHSVSVDLQLAVERVSQATGMLFADVGTTAAPPPSYSASSVPGLKDGPVLVDWSTSARPPAGYPAGSAGALAQTVPVAAVDPTSGDGVYVTGSMVLDRAAATLPSGFGPGSLGVLLLHELGELVGLGPADAPGQVMNPAVLSSTTASFGRGDLAGLARLGAHAGCLDVPTGATLEPTL